MGRRRLSEGLDASAKKRLVRLVESGVPIPEAAKRFSVGYNYAFDLVKESRDVEVASVEPEPLPVRRED